MPNERTDTATVVREAIAAEVRAEAARQQKSQRDIAAILGTSQPSVNLRLKGERPFRAEELILLADAFGVSVDQFIPDALRTAPAVTA